MAALKNRLRNVRKSKAYRQAKPAKKKQLLEKAKKQWRQNPKNFTPKQMGGKYQYSRAFLEATPELLEIFRTGFVKEHTEDKMVAEIMNTQWFRDHSVAWKDVEKTRLQNPGEYNRAIEGRKSEIRLQANQMGADVTEEELALLAKDALYAGWSEADMRFYVGAEIDIEQQGSLFGEAGENELGLRKMASDNGLVFADSWYKNHSREKIRTGDQQAAVQQIREDAANAYSQWGDELRAGTTTVKQKASTYLTSMENIYDMTEGSASLSDPKMMQALQSRDSEDKQVTVPLWKFEQDLRSDPKWASTKNGAKAMSGVANGMLQEWGFLNG